jgi:RNA 2',3'-cyclic 3'-phosphodiesterase
MNANKPSVEPNKLRAFIAIDVPKEMKEKIINFKNTKIDDIKLVAKENMHITIEFLDYLSKEQLEKIKTIINALDKKCFEISINGFGSFPFKDPRVVFAKIEKGSNELIIINKFIRNKLKEIGIKHEIRFYTPHLTISRVNRQIDTSKVVDFINEYTTYDFGSFVCSSIKIKISKLSENGATHTDFYTKKFA